MVFLTDKELTELTGYKRGKEQCGWLKERGWVFETESHGRPRVAREYCERKMGVQDVKTKQWEPDFSTI